MGSIPGSEQRTRVAGPFNGRQLSGLEVYSISAKECNILNFCGMMKNDTFQKIIDDSAIRM